LSLKVPTDKIHLILLETIFKDEDQSISFYYLSCLQNNIRGTYLHNFKINTFITSQNLKYIKVKSIPIVDHSNIGFILNNGIISRRLL